MAHKKLYGNRREKACEICEYGKLTADGEAVLCARMGVVPSYHHCRRFRYDPLKRIPARRNPLPDFSQESFSLYEPKNPPQTETDEAATAKNRAVTQTETLPPETDTDNPLGAAGPSGEEQGNPSALTLTREMVERIQDYLHAETAPTLSGILSQIDSQAPPPVTPADVPKENPPEKMVPDDTPDIYGDLERLTATRQSGEAQANPQTAEP